MDEKRTWRSAKLVRIGISVEGTTEERFVEKIIYPHLLTKNIYISPISLGGNVNLDKIRSELQKIANSFDYVTTFYDFYGFKGKEKTDTKEKLEEKIIDKTHKNIRKKLIPYIQMHEFEALLFSGPNAMQQALGIYGLADWAETILKTFKNNPEAINDSVNTAPSKRIEGKFNYIKTTHGPDIASVIGLEKIRVMCDGFDKWLTKLENLT